MTRRDAAWLFASALGLAGTQEFLTGWLRAAQSHESNSFAPPDPENWTDYSPRFFSREDFQTLERFMTILIPTDETPGAREAHTAAFADFFVNAAAEYAPEVQQQWRDALLYLRTHRFADLSPDAQVSSIEQMSAPERDGSAKHDGFETYRLIKDMTVHAFYTSRIGLIDVLEYKGNAYLIDFPGCTHPEHQHV